ncbi:MAG TPA: alpha/beta fold hydrolase [Pyrinomonadaceae bacterium]|nr:alpha/beta fold hydrolase [Pyrinomonadaceae bacterium]
MRRKAALALLLLAASVTCAQSSRDTRGVRPPEATRVVEFRLRGYHAHGGEIALAGSFNDWRPARGSLARDGDFLWRVPLKPGKHAYKFFVNGRAILDPHNLSAEADAEGNVNSVIVVGERGGVLTNLMPESVARRLDIRDGMVDVGGHRLHFNCTGQRRAGRPVVVLEAGNMSSSQVWFKVRPRVAEFARVCAYDRAGRGGSEEARGEPHTGEDIVRDLRVLLSKAGERAPFVLVGHSLGGVLARIYASRHPREVAGMVLVDSAHEEQDARAEAMIPEEVKAQFTEEERRVMSSERLDFVRLFAEARAPRFASDIPLEVLTAGRFDAGITDPRIAPLAPKFEELRLELQRELVSRSPRGRQTIARQSGHFIHWDEPELVVEAIRRVVSEASARGAR